MLGTSFTLTAAESGYSSASQIVLFGGGWCLFSGDASRWTGLVSMRSSGGDAAFVESVNPANLRQWYVSPFTFLFVSGS